MHNHFENFVRGRCRELRLSQTELARRAGMSRETLYRLLRGEVATPSIVTLRGLASSLEVSILQMLRLYFDDLCLGNDSQLPSRQDGDQLSFVGDVTFPDETTVAPSQTFTKTWALQNTGNAIWQGRQLVCQDEDYVLAKLLPGGRLVPEIDCQLVPTRMAVPVPDARPGEVVEVSAEFTAPPLPCIQVSFWKMADAEGGLCFPGHAGLWVKVRVVTP